MGAPKKYTPEKLDRAVRKYFRTITREKTLTEKVDSGQRDKMGHVVWEEQVVLNSLGQPLKVTEYLVPPTIGDLSEFLGIHRDTWNEYCNHEKHPEFSDTTTYARGRIHAYLEREMLTRSGKDTKGIQFNLENNFGYRQRLEVAGTTLEQFLREAEDGGGGQLF